MREGDAAGRSCSKQNTHACERRRREIPGAAKSFFSVLSHCVLPGRGAFSDRRNASPLSSTCGSAWLVFWRKRNQVTSQKKMCGSPPPPHARSQISRQWSLLTFRAVFRSVAGMEMEQGAETREPQPPCCNTGIVARAGDDFFIKEKGKERQ